MQVGADDPALDDSASAGEPAWPASARGGGEGSGRRGWLDKEAPLFQACRTSLFAAGEPLLKRAQDVGLVRHDVELSEVMHMVIGITKIPSMEPKQVEHILRIALDGLRYHAPG